MANDSRDLRPRRVRSEPLRRGVGNRIERRFRYVSNGGELLQVDSRPRRQVTFSSLAFSSSPIRCTHPGPAEATLHTDGGPLNVAVIGAQSPPARLGVQLVGDRLEFADIADVFRPCGPGVEHHDAVENLRVAAIERRGSTT